MNSVILPEVSGASCHIEKTGQHAAENNPAANSENIPRRDSTFLVLAPAKSSAYQSQPVSSATSSPSVGPVASAIVEPITKERRSSSISSTGSFSKRYLKLSPVHGGGDPGVPDYVDIEEE